MLVTTKTSSTFKKDSLANDMKIQSSANARQIATNAEEEEIHKTIYWWCLLSSIAIINICLWCYTYHSLKVTAQAYNSLDEPMTISSIHYYQRYHLTLSVIDAMQNQPSAY